MAFCAPPPPSPRATRIGTSAGTGQRYRRRHAGRAAIADQAAGTSNAVSGACAPAPAASTR
jgi:hypothetical protein